MAFEWTIDESGFVNLKLSYRINVCTVCIGRDRY